jgi:Uma2 family endonuclease
MSPTSAISSLKPKLILEDARPDHTQLPESDGSFEKNFQEHPQSIILTSSIEPVLQQLHPDGQYCIGQDSGIYWTLTQPPEKGAEAPDWFYVANVPPLLNGEYRRSYVLWKEKIVPLIAIEFVSGNGDEERDNTPPPKAGKFWVYEQAIKIPFYAIYEVRKASVEVYQLIDGRYARILPNQRGHYAIAPMGVELGLLEKGSIPWLRWWDADGNLLLTAEERVVAVEVIALQERIAKENAEAIAEQERLIALQERNEKLQERLAKQKAEQKAQRLAEMLKAMGIDTDEI